MEAPYDKLLEINELSVAFRQGQRETLAVDRVSFEIHDLSKRAKDLASAAVFLSLLLCAGIWIAALWHRWSAV